MDRAELLALKDQLISHRYHTLGNEARYLVATPEQVRDYHGLIEQLMRGLLNSSLSLEEQVELAREVFVTNKLTFDPTKLHNAWNELIDRFMPIMQGALA